ncbi:hypothetical protein MKX03_015952 [Papaver bracteatum]|nr:hypothetical protein MKX03_015952 [Papaver bracteatum]
MEVGRMNLGSQGFQVSKQGLGCMGMSAFYGPAKPESDMINLIHHAIDKGVTFLHTSYVYGPFTNEILTGKATKFACSFEDGGRVSIRGDPEYVRDACKASLKRLQVDYIDLYYHHRTDTTVPIEIGLSEASASTIRRAHVVHPITVVQLEWSLWSRDNLPRFQPENLEQNKHIFERVNELAQKKGCSPSQLALAWVHHQGTDVCPIPGTTKVENLNQNVGALAVKLTEIELAELKSIASGEDAVKGERHSEMKSTWKYSETPSLSSWKKE